MFDVLCGVLLLCIGYIAGKREKPKAQPVELSEEEKRAEQKSIEEWEKLLKFSGRGGRIEP